MRKLFVTVCFLFVAYASFGQQQTAYEKKVYSLRVQLLRKLGVSQTLLDQKSKLSDLEGFFLMGDILRKLNTEQGLLLLLQFNRELKDAEKLKTSVDFQREKEKKEKEEREAKIKEIENQKKQAILDKERLEKEKIEKYNSSDLVQLNKIISTKFSVWLKKGEFEKTDDFESRIKSSCLSSFEKTCNEAIEDRINQISYNNIQFDLKGYNADKEYFNIEIKFRDLKWTDVIKVPINKAPTFKENFSINKNQLEYKNWGVYNNELYPETIVTKSDDDESHIEFKLPVTKLDDYITSTNKLGLSSTPSTNVEFSLFNYTQKLQKEKELEEIKKKQREEDLLKQEEERKRKEAEEFEQKKIKAEKERQEQELLRKREEERRKFEASDYGQLKRAIKTEFSAWLEKKEFESQTDFEKRVKTNYETELKKIVDEKIKSSIRRDKQICSAALGAYDLDKEEFEVKIFGEYRTPMNPVYIKIPKKLAESLKAKFGSESASQGKPLFVHVLESKMVDNKWQPYRMFIMFSNGAENGYGNKGYFDPYYWNATRIIDNGKDRYSLGYASNININPVKLKNINTQFDSKTLDYEMYYYDYIDTSISQSELNFTLESLEIKLPF